MLVACAITGADDTGVSADVGASSADGAENTAVVNVGSVAVVAETAYLLLNACCWC